jgi:CMP-N-acetylneuraminic acid synthetase
MNRVLIIIPARLGSKRLKHKNILPIKGLPMCVYIAREALKSKFKPEVYVSTESIKIINLCKMYKIKYIKRPNYLAKDHVEKQEAIVHAFQKLKNKIKPKVIVSLQVNTPQLKIKDLDNAIIFFKKITFPKKPIKEVISLGKDKLQNGAFRIMTPLGVCKKTLSTNIGVYFTDYIDVHDLNDYKKAKKKIEKN